MNGARASERLPAELGHALNGYVARGQVPGIVAAVEREGFDQHGWGFGMAVVTKTDDLWQSPGSFGWEWRSRYVEDPVYLAQPAQWSGKWEYRPTMRHSNQKCDVEVARKFLQQ